MACGRQRRSAAISCRHCARRPGSAATRSGSTSVKIQSDLSKAPGMACTVSHPTAESNISGKVISTSGRWSIGMMVMTSPSCGRTGWRGSSGHGISPKYAKTGTVASTSAIVSREALSTPLLQNTGRQVPHSQTRPAHQQTPNQVAQAACRCPRASGGEQG